MTNRAFYSVGLRLGSLLLVAAGAARAAVCTSCHEQSAQLAKSAHAALRCDQCPGAYDIYPHPAGTAKPACVTCHNQAASDYAQSANGHARKSGNAGAPDCALCHGGAHGLLAPGSEAFRKAVPDGRRQIPMHKFSNGPRPENNLCQVDRL